MNHLFKPVFLLVYVLLHPLAGNTQERIVSINDSFSSVVIYGRFSCLYLGGRKKMNLWLRDEIAENDIKYSVIHGVSDCSWQK